MFKLTVKVKNGDVVFRSFYLDRSTKRESCVTEFVFKRDDKKELRLTAKQIIRFIAFLANHLQGENLYNRGKA